MISKALDKLNNDTKLPRCISDPEGLSGNFYVVNKIPNRNILLHIT